MSCVGPPDAANSRIRGSSPVVANGVAASTVEITINDASNTPVFGVTPTFSATGSNNIPPRPDLSSCSPTNGSGVSTCSLKSTTAEIKTLSIVTPVARLGGTVTFTPGALDHLTISPTTSTIASGGSEFYTAQGFDAFNNSFDITSTTTFSVAGGSCTGSTCTATATGQHAVTGKNSGKTSPLNATFLTVSPPAGLVKVWVGLANSDDVGIKFDLKAIVNNGGLENSGQLGSVGGGSGFNAAVLDTIPLLGQFSSVSSGSLSAKVLVRNACSNSSKSSGRARLWFNGANFDTGTKKDAGSRFVPPTGTTLYFLRTGSLLNTAAGAARTFIDVPVGAKCGPYQSFGTWSITVP